MLLGDVMVGFRDKVKPFAVPFASGGFVVLFFGIGLVVHMSLPRDVHLEVQALLGPKAAPEPSVENPDDIPRGYASFRLPITLSLERFGNLRLEFGMAITARDHVAIRAFLFEQPEPFMAPMGDALTRLGDNVDTVEALRAAIPATLAAVLNDQLEAGGKGRPILDVYILGFHLG